MSSFTILTVVTIVFVVIQNADYMYGKGGYHTNRELKGSPLFCIVKYKACVDKGKRMRPPYSTTPKYCQHQVYRKYYCTLKQLQTNITEEESNKYHIRGMNDDSEVVTSSEETMEANSSSEESSISSESSEGGIPPTDFIRELHKHDLEEVTDILT